MLSNNGAIELRKDFADDWERTKGFTVPDLDWPLPSPNLIPTPDSISQVIMVVASIANLPVGTILGDRRSQRVVRYRAMAMLIAHELTGKTTTQLGMAFNRDHTTVIHAIKGCKERMKDPKWAAEYRQALRELA